MELNGWIACRFNVMVAVRNAFIANDDPYTQR